jgi:hypothetical protein
VAGAAQVLVAIVGIGIALHFLPLPEIDVPTPDISIPSLPVPDIQLPEWARDVLGTTKYWLPVLIGIGLALRELERRKRDSE